MARDSVVPDYGRLDRPWTAWAGPEGERQERREQEPV